MTMGFNSIISSWLCSMAIATSLETDRGSLDECQSGGDLWTEWHLRRHICKYRPLAHHRCTSVTAMSNKIARGPVQEKDEWLSLEEYRCYEDSEFAISVNHPTVQRHYTNTMILRPGGNLDDDERPRSVSLISMSDVLTRRSLRESRATSHHCL